jgi:hypothetical protein
MRSLRKLVASGLSGFVRRYERGYPGRVGGGATGNGVLEVLKARCEIRRGRTPGLSDVAEERRRACGAQ